MSVDVFSQNTMRLTIPCTEAKSCTKYMTEVLKWLDTVYFAYLPTVNEFEEPILSDNS